MANLPRTPWPPTALVTPAAYQGAIQGIAGNAEPALCR
jgi:hypothetical protein